jgi:hypothetical protein
VLDAPRDSVQHEAATPNKIAMNNAARPAATVAAIAHRGAA